MHVTTESIGPWECAVEGPAPMREDFLKKGFGEVSHFRQNKYLDRKEANTYGQLKDHVAEEV